MQRTGPADRPAGAPTISLWALFLAFAGIALSSFGGAVAWSRHVLVVRRGWLTEREFAELFGLCQALPGPNIVNLSIHFGTRHHGAAGAAVAFAGFLLVPLVVVLPLVMVYSYGGHIDVVRTALRGVAAAASGLLLASGLKLALAYRHDPAALLIGAVAFMAVGLLRWPLLAVLLALAPCSIYLAWRRRS